MTRPSRDTLAKMSRSELLAVHEELSEMIRVSETEAKRDAKQAIIDKAHEFGFELSDLVGTKVRRPSQPSKRLSHPQNPELVYGGRGPRPGWLKDFLDEGNTMDQLVVIE